MQTQFQVNVFGPLQLVRCALPFMEHGSRIINIGSISARITLPFMGPYSASKAALARLSSALRSELYPLGIYVSLIEAGNFRTPIWQKSINRFANILERCDARLKNIYSAPMDRAIAVAKQMENSSADPAVIVCAIVSILECRNPASLYRIGVDAWAWSILDRILPLRAIEWIGRAVVKMNKFER
ncbi:hypothetical protein CCP2SC5_330038 [Azospirillaceae bacterium]